MSEKLQDLFELLKVCLRLSEVPNNVRRYDLSPVASLLLSKVELLQSMNAMLVHDATEKFLCERHGIAFGKTAVMIVSETGRSTAPFTLSRAAVHPVTRATPDLQPHSPMVLDVWGQTYTPGAHQHGQDVFYELKETEGDVLVICPTQP